MCHVGCTLFSKALFYPMFSRFSCVVAGEVRLPSEPEQRSPDSWRPYGGFLRHDSSIPTRFFAVTIKVVFKRNEGETNSNLNLPISRTTRHGTTVLALPSRVFWMDLTLHMDIEANPGPEGDAVATRRKSSLEPYLNYCHHNNSLFKESITQSQIERFHLSRPLTSA